MLKAMSSKMVSYETNFTSFSSRNDENHATVIIFNVSWDLSNPTKRRQVLEQVCGHELIMSVRPVGDKMIVSIDKTAAPEFCVSAQSVLSYSIGKMKAKKYYHLVKGIESDFELGLFKEVPGITDATRLGNSDSVKLCFTDARSLDHALKDVGYSRRRLWTWALPTATFILDILAKRRETCDEEFALVFEQVKELSDKIQLAVEVPRITQRQVYRNNPPYTTPEEYYRRVVFIPILD
ncbi:hypothetical protein QYM36_005865 [Artemia franciscana]|uniref:Uncharacterized protein n=1 Tax=Artemia franciscana TaxID=6661 RepID=A0AA88I2H0_ARTSF|nr:hypothetical protein QYM36_005865 [Artemia franciscana]